MPDGSILKSCAEVDRYYGFKDNTTFARLKIGWSNEECASNKRTNGGKFVFHMPDGTILTKARDVDRYFKLKLDTTKKRLSRGWSEDECVSNIINDKRKNGEYIKYGGKYKFHMPDGSILTTAVGVDRYYGFKKSTTSQRLKRGWTVEECARNKRGSYN